MEKKNKCVNCKKFFKIERFNQVACTIECSVQFTIKNRLKAEKEKTNEMKEGLLTVTDYFKKAKTEFQIFIRNRDKNKPCISCLKPAKKSNAGHFFDSIRFKNVAFNEHNCNIQCEPCNRNLSGNLLKYRENLILKIGLENFRILEEESEIEKKYTIEELKEIIIKYKNLNK